MEMIPSWRRRLHCKSAKLNALGTFAPSPSRAQIAREGFRPSGVLPMHYCQMPMQPTLEGGVARVSNMRLEGDMFMFMLPPMKGAGLVVGGVSKSDIAQETLTLHYVPPEMRKGDIVVRPTLNMIDEGSKHWNTTGWATSSVSLLAHLQSFCLLKKQGSKSIVTFMVEVVADYAGDVGVEVAVKTQAGVNLAGQLKPSSSNSNKRAQGKEIVLFNPFLSWTLLLVLMLRNLVNW
ncbi:hypothetical protein Salat_0233900 [Sesamum alatum]|uniref:Uncharacterized protein n=1 Tax=Sesamum alatum TaxID=300844 RepID=A0AAE2CYC2_9LAMI|nr:hypothetical protein Salat_0233900 [Sesamum alatum]